MTTWNVGYNAAGAALDFTTLTTFESSGLVSAGDEAVLFYSDATMGRRWAGFDFNGKKPFSVRGGLDGRAVIITSEFLVRYLTSAGHTLTFSNMTFVGTRGVRFEASVNACDAIVERNFFVGCPTVGVNVNDVGGSRTVKNNLAMFCGIGFQKQVATDAHTTLFFYHNTAFGCATGISIAGNNTITMKNNACIGNSTNYGGVTQSYADYNATDDSTAPGTNVLTTTQEAARLVRNYSNGLYPVDARVIAGSSLIGAGVDVGEASDIDGQAFGGSYPIGCSNGVIFIDPNMVLTTATPPGNVPAGKVRVPYGTETLPTESQVLDGVGFGDAGTEYEGNVTLPVEADVKGGVLYGPNDSLEGDYSATLPDAPTLTITDKGDGTGLNVVAEHDDGSAVLTLSYMAVGGDEWIEIATGASPLDEDIPASTGLYLILCEVVTAGGMNVAVASARATDNSQKVTQYRVIDVKRGEGSAVQRVKLQKIEKPLGW